MIYGSLFSGCGGFDLGLDAAGLTCAFQCEIDKQARAVLRHRWPEVPKHEDIRTLSGKSLPRVDLLVGGFPCQDVSLAGGRAGWGGESTGLFYEFLRLALELAPEWLLLENVPGLLSATCPDSDGNPVPGGACHGGCMAAHGGAMGTVLGALGELGYGWTYRVLDAQYFGVPQRRERVFIVGRAGGYCPPEVLFEPDVVPWNPPPCRQAREDVTGCLGGQPAGGGWRDDTDRMTFVPDTARCVTSDGERYDGESETFIARPLRAQAQSSHRADSETYVSDRTVAVCPQCCAVLIERGMAVAGETCQACRFNDQVAHTLRANGFDASEDGTGRGTPLVAFRGAGQDGFKPGQVAPPLCSTKGGGTVPAIAFDWYASDSQSMPTGRICPPLKTTMQPAVAFQCHGSNVGEMDALRTGHNEAGGVPFFATVDLAQITSPTHRSQPDEGKPVGTLNGSARQAAFGYAGVRRLTPLECERLMGWPEVRKQAIVTVCGDSRQSDVRVVLKNLKSRLDASLADGARSRQIAPFAQPSSCVCHLDHGHAAPLNVSVSCDHGAVRIHSRAADHLSPASHAEESELSVRPGNVGVSALSLVGLVGCLENMPRDGRADSRLNVATFIARESGGFAAVMFGAEMMRLAKDALCGSTIREPDITYITSGRGSIESQDLKWLTSFFCVLNAITGFTQERIADADSFSLNVTLIHGHTAHGVTDSGKRVEMADGPRYRMAGNGVVAPVATWIARRILNAHCGLRGAA